MESAKRVIIVAGIGLSPVWCHHNADTSYHGSVSFKFHSNAFNDAVYKIPTIFLGPKGDRTVKYILCTQQNCISVLAFKTQNIKNHRESQTSSVWGQDNEPIVDDAVMSIWLMCCPTTIVMARFRLNFTRII